MPDSYLSVFNQQWGTRLIGAGTRDGPQHLKTIRPKGSVSRSGLSYEYPKRFRPPLRPYGSGWVYRPVYAVSGAAAEEDISLQVKGFVLVVVAAASSVWKGVEIACTTPEGTRAKESRMGLSG
jgi:hypothetical protein